MSKNIKKNFIFQGVYQILAIFLPFITSPYIARVLGAEKIGIYSYTYSIANFFVLFAMLGLNNYGNREIAMARDDKIILSKKFSNIYCMHILISLIIILIYFLYSSLGVKEYRIYFLIQGIYVIGALFDINWFFFGLEEFKITVIRNLIIKILTVCSVFIFVHTQSDLWKYTLIMAVGSFVSQSMIWMFIGKYIDFLRPSWKEMRSHLKPLIILFIPVISISLYTIMDKVMLGFLSTKAQVGLYENSEKLLNIPMALINALGMVMLPRISNLIAKGNISKSKDYFRISMQFALLIAFLFGGGLAGVAPEFAPLFWGEEFAASGILITYLCITIPFLAFANVIRTQYLIPNGLDKIYILSTVFGGITNLIINFLLISKHQAIGAVIATVFAEISVCVVQVCAVRKKVNVIRYLKDSFPFCFFSIFMYIVIRLIGNSQGVKITTIILQVVGGGTIYLGLCLLYFIRTKNMIYINFIMNLIKK